MPQLHFILQRLWANVSLDPLALFAIVVGVGGILRADWLFHKLYKREKERREAQLREADTVVESYAAFSRALQGLKLDERELTKDGAFALLTSFRIKQILFPGFKPEQHLELRKLTRAQIEAAAREYAELMIRSGLATLKEGVEFNPEFKKQT